ncbi:unnamed protein product [Effrenium voratum]|nr:unnamed protein product [Effrenium voratum]
MFDWCESHEKLQPVLEAALGFAQQEDEQLRVLDVGCGTSTLALALWDQGRRRVHAVDVDGAVIRQMASSHSAEGLTFEEVDVTRQSLGEHCFDLARATALKAIDKGTMDYLLCIEIQPALAALAAVRRALREGGILLLVSIHPVDLWKALFAALRSDGALGFEELQCWSLPASRGGDQTAALALRRTATASPCVGSTAEGAAAAVLDQHFAVEAPLLTEQRRAELRRAWGGEDRRPAEEVHQLLFSAAEQAEYTLQLFLEDLNAGEEPKVTLSLAEAEDFLRQNQ